MGVVVAGRPRGAYAPLEACACRGHIFKHLMAACLQSGHQLPLDSIFVSRGKSVPLAFALNGLDMPPACICLTQGNSFLRINLTQKNASAIGGILSPAGLPTSTQSLSTEHSTHKKLRKKNNLSFSREERRVRQEIYNI